MIKFRIIERSDGLLVELTENIFAWAFFIVLQGAHGPMTVIDSIITRTTFSGSG
jgi:hypothetical protein